MVIANLALIPNDVADATLSSLFLSQVYELEEEEHEEFCAACCYCSFYVFLLFNRPLKLG